MTTAGKRNPSLITFEQALRIIESSAGLPRIEEIPLTKALNRVLAQSVRSDDDIPPFNKAAMDGYACRRNDLGNELLVIEEIPAGKVPVKTIGPGQCARIMTGAMLPEGADYILIQEYAGHTASNTIQCVQQSEHANICYKGEDIKLGETILESGTKLLPAQIAILATAGCVLPRVYGLPEIAVISTGDELVEPDQDPAAGKIRNSNGIQLVAQIAQQGLHADYLGILPDNRQALMDKLSAALQKYDLVMMSGGVSVGEYDFVPGIIRELQMEVLIRGINVKPGKHFLLARKGQHFVAGMPGNPVSSFVLFEVMVKPLVRKLMGSCEGAVRFRVPLEKTYNRKNSDTLFFIPVYLTGNGTVQTIEYHGSAHIHAYTGANGIMEVPVGVSEIKEGGMAYVRPI
jgi:molybdopterin molybdotransferase